MSDEKTIVYTFLENPLYRAAATVVIYASLKKVIGKSLKLKKQNDGYRQIAVLPEELRMREKLSSYKVTKVGIKKEASICLSTFIEEMRKNPRADMANFCKLCEAYSISNMKPKKIGGSTWYGMYMAGNNQIFVDEHDVRKNIFHELMHRLVTRVFDNYIYTGFKQVKLGVKKGLHYTIFCIGDGINEAYTQMLTERYFTDYGCGQSYVILTDLAYFTESIVGAKKMEKFYFDSDLYSLVNELAKYSSKEEAIEFIRTFDVLFDRYYNRGTHISLMLAKRTYKKLLKMLFAMEIEKIKKEIKEGARVEDVINREQFIVECILTSRKRVRLRQIQFEYGLDETDLYELGDVIRRELEGYGITWKFDEAFYEYKT